MCVSKTQVFTRFLSLSHFFLRSPNFCSLVSLHVFYLSYRRFVIVPLLRIYLCQSNIFCSEYTNNMLILLLQPDLTHSFIMFQHALLHIKGTQRDVLRLTLSMFSNRVQNSHLQTRTFIGYIVLSKSSSEANEKLIRKYSKHCSDTSIVKKNVFTAHIQYCVENSLNHDRTIHIETDSCSVLSIHIPANLLHTLYVI